MIRAPFFLLFGFDKGTLKQKGQKATTQEPRGSGWFTRFPSSPFKIRVPFFLQFGFNKGTQKEKGQKGTTGEPSLGLGVRRGQG